MLLNTIGEPLECGQAIYLDDDATKIAVIVEDHTHVGDVQIETIDGQRFTYRPSELGLTWIEGYQS